MTFNFAFWLSLILAAAGCTGLILAGKGRWYGWGVGLAVQPVWATYAIVTKGYGLLLTCLMYGFVNSKNLYQWWKKDNTIVYNRIAIKTVEPEKCNKASKRTRNHTLPRKSYYK